MASQYAESRTGASPSASTSLNAARHSSPRPAARRGEKLTPRRRSPSLSGSLGTVVVGTSGRPAATQLVDLDQGVPQLADPLGLVPPDQPHAPGERLAPAARHAGLHQGV